MTYDSVAIGDRTSLYKVPDPRVLEIKGTWLWISHLFTLAFEAASPNRRAFSAACFSD